MPLPKLARRTERLPKLAAGMGQDDTPLALNAQKVNLKDIAPEEQYAVYPPFNSTGEVYVWSFIRGKNPYWRLQVPIGDQRIAGSSRVDFLNDQLRIALYPEGAYFHWGTAQQAKDALKYALVKARGYRIVLFYYRDIQDAIDRFPEFYRDNIGA